MRINVGILLSGKRVIIDADPIERAREIVDVLLDAEIIWPAPKYRSYYLALEEPNNYSRLDMDDTLQSNGIKEDDRLELFLSGLGGPL